MTAHLPIYSHCLESVSSIFLIRERGWPDLPAVVSIVDALFILWRELCNDCSVQQMKLEIEGAAGEFGVQRNQPCRGRRQRSQVQTGAGFKDPDTPTII
jgi:hypothetical protein